MLEIFDKNHNAIGHIVKYKDCKIESELSTGDKTLYFTYMAKHHILSNEMYVRTKDDEYVIKEVPGTTGSFPQIVAVLNLEELQKDMWQTFSVTDVTIDEAVRTVLAGTGWTIGECNVTKRRNAGMMNVSSLDVIKNLCKAFMCEPVFDTINKKVSFYVQRGEDKGVYFMSGLNLKKLQKKSTSYDYYTRIIPIGSNGLTIESVNDGKNYLENYQYSNKELTYIWKDESYTDAQALKDDAELKLNDLSKPVLSYSAEVSDLAKQKTEYAILSYGIGDNVTLIDRETGTRDKQRIVKLVEYPQNPEKNTCELANTVLTFEEMQQKVQEAADIINFTVTGDGRYTGTINVSDILHFEQGISGSVTIGGINSSISTMQGDIAQVKMTVGEIDANYIKAEEANLKYATIENLNVTNETVHSIQGDYASFKSTVTDEFAAQLAIIDNLSGRYATFEQTVTDELITAKGWMLEGSIGSAQISSVDANKIKSGTIDTALVNIAGTDGRLQIIDNTIQISDSNRVRVQVGKDASGDYTLAVWDVAGNLIWDALGATENTIQRKIIRDKMVADDAAIKALKLDLQSINTALTDQGVTISGTVVQVGDKTLNVELSEKTQLITEQGEKLTDHAARIAANENAISLRVTTQEYESNKTTINNEIASAKNRLTTAESSITALDGQIALKVEQTDIDTAVNNLQVGGRNLLRQTKDYSFEGINAYGSSTIQSEAYMGFTVRYLRCNGGTFSEMSHYTSAVTPEGGAQYVFSFYAKGTRIRAHFYSGSFKPVKAVSSTGSISYAPDGQIDIALTSEWKRYWIVYTLEDTNTLSTTGNKHVLLRVMNGYEAYACGLMFEKGNKPSNWTPAPEDIDASISAVDAKFVNYSTTTQMQSAIDIAKDSITQSVSATYATKASVETANGNITSLTSRVQTAESKLTKDGLTTIVGDYYTTATVVDSKIDAVQVGGRNLLFNSKGDSTTGWFFTGTVSYDSRFGKCILKSTTGTSEVFLGTPRTMQVDKSAKYTFSCYVWVNSYVSSVDIWWLSDTESDKKTTSNGFVNTLQILGNKKFTPGQWNRVEITFTTKSDDYTGFIRIDNNGSTASGSSASMYITRLKLEKGNKATDWSPAPEDVDSSISAVQTIAEQTATKFSWLVKSGTSSTDFTLTDRTATLVANAINLNGLVTFSGLNSDTQSKINTAQSTADSAKTEAANAQSTANSAKAWTDENGSNMTSLLSMVKKWTNNAVSDTTAIQGGWIATNTITANKLAIGDFTNYCTVNPNYPDTMLPSSFPHGGTVINATADTGSYVIGKANASQEYLMLCNYTPMCFNVGDELYFYGNLPNYSSTDCSARVSIWLYNSNKGYIRSYDFWSGTLKAKIWNKISGSVKITNVTDARYFLIGISTGTNSHVIGACDYICRKKSSGALIVDGTITTNKLAAKSITTEKLAANAVTAEKINTSDLFAQDITATGTIRGVKLIGVSVSGSTITSTSGSYTTTIKDSSIDMGYGMIKPTTKTVYIVTSGDVVGDAITSTVDTVEKSAMEISSSVGVDITVNSKTAVQFNYDSVYFKDYYTHFAKHIYTEGGVRCVGPFNAAATSSGTPMVFSAAGWMRKSSSSSKRYKNHVRNMTDADVSKLYDLSPVWFTYKDGYLDKDDVNVGKPIPGFYAEDVLECFQSAVRYNASGQVEDWDYKTMIPAMMMMVQSQRKEWTTAVDAVKNDVDCLRAKTESDVDSLKSQVSSLQYQLEQAYMRIATLEKQQQAAG